MGATGGGHRREHRIEVITEDLVAHFEKCLETLEGKAMVVCMSRRICVEMYNAITRLRPEWHSDDDTSGAVKVVMSGSASEKPEWQMHFRTKAQRNRIRNRFVDPDVPLRQFVIVRDMWITGFDAPCLHTMYVDKPMQGHTLMQTIARVNRVFRDKPGGLIVDYLGIAPKLKEALAEFTDEGKKHKGLSVEEQEEAVYVMLEKYEFCCDILHGFDWSVWNTGDPGKRLSLIPAAMEHVLSQQDGKSRFLDAVTQLSTAFSLCVPHEETDRIRTDVAFFQTIKVCQVHCTRAVLRNIPRIHQKEVAESLKEAYGNEKRLQQLADDLNERGYRKAANTIERFLPGLMSYTAFPKRHWKRLRTTNTMERFNKELKRRTKVAGVFPNEESLLRLVGSILMDVNEEWVTGKKYLQMHEYRKYETLPRLMNGEINV